MEENQIFKNLRKTKINYLDSKCNEIGLREAKEIWNITGKHKLIALIANAVRETSGSHKKNENK